MALERFSSPRGKDTRRPSRWHAQRPCLAALQAYIARLRIELHGEAYIFRNRSGAAYSSDTLGDDLRDVRHATFGRHESRTLADFRRSGAVEAIAGVPRPKSWRMPWATPSPPQMPSSPPTSPLTERPCRRSWKPAAGAVANFGNGTKSAQKSERDGPKSRNSTNGLR
jgi:hypothetical protein